MTVPRPRVLLPAAGVVLATGACALLAPAAAPFALVFLLAIAWAAAVRAGSGSLSPDRLVRAGLLVAIAAGLQIPALLGMIHSANALLNGLTGSFAAVHRRDALWAAAGLSILVLAARKWPQAWGERFFLAAATVAALAVKLAWVRLVHMEPVSDFQVMWSLTSEIADKGLKAATELPSPLLRLYVERVLPYLLPLRLLFGPEPSSYAIPNVLATVATSWLTWLTARRWLGVRAARLAFLLSLAAVEALMAAEIPTHDIPGALYTFLALALFLRACDLYAGGRTRAAAAAASAFGLAAVIVGLQRTTGPYLLLSCGLLGPLAVGLGEAPGEGRRRRETARAALVLLLLPLAVYVGTSRGLRAAGVIVPPDQLARQRGPVLAANESWGDGDPTLFFEHYRELPVDWYGFAASKMASDTWYTPSARVSQYLRKATLLFNLGSQTPFYVHGAELAGTGVIEGRREERVLFLSRCFTVFFLALFLRGSLRLWTEPRLPLPAFLPPFFLAVLALLLLAAGQVQPRYLFQIWSMGAIYAGLAFREPPPETGPA